MDHILNGKMTRNVVNYSSKNKVKKADATWEKKKKKMKGKEQINAPKLTSPIWETLRVFPAPCAFAGRRISIQ